MPNVLILFAHPAYSKSRAQKTLLKYCRNIEGVTFNDLYEHYPDLYIDVPREKELLTRHDIIVLQHPFFWYSGPAIIKQWLDLVLEYNWAYGPHGEALNGKKMLSAITCGGRKEAYSSSGHHMYTVNEFLIPYRQTASLCHMEYLPPFIVYGTHLLSLSALEAYGEAYAKLLSDLVNGSVTPSAYQQVKYLNEANGNN